MISKKLLKEEYKACFYGLVFIVLFFIALQFDLKISSAISDMRTSLLSSILILLTPTLASAVLIALASVIVYLNNKKKVLYMWLSLAVSLGVSVILKAVIARPRPFANGISTASELIKESYTSWDFSFPSNHTILMFAMLPFMPKKWFWPWLVIACIVAFSRVYFGLHYLSDVIAGAAIGLGIAYLISKKVK